jgi:hypothetical protein
MMTIYVHLDNQKLMIFLLLYIENLLNGHVLVSGHASDDDLCSIYFRAPQNVLISAFKLKCVTFKNSYFQFIFSTMYSSIVIHF